MALLDIIRTKLISAGVGNTTTWKVFVGFAPDVQNQIISLHLTGGFAQDTLGGESVEESFQLRVRSAALEYSACESKWRSAFNALHDADLSASGIRLIQAMATGPLEYYDEKDRPNFTTNFRVKRDKP